MITPAKKAVLLAALSIVVLGLCWKDYRDRKNHQVLSKFVEIFVGAGQGVELWRTNGLNAATPAATAQCLRNVAEYDYPDWSIWYFKPGSTGAKYVASASKNTQYLVTEVQRIVARERTDAIKDLIARLRVTTGQDLGGDPQKWIKEFAYKKYPRSRPNG